MLDPYDEHFGILFIMENLTKICFKCGKGKLLREFYKHPRMSDGHLNKCKDCTKIDVSERLHKKYMDKDWVERERERGREKYRRLGYRDIARLNKVKQSISDPEYRNKMRKYEMKRKKILPYSNAKRDLRLRGIDLGDKHAHHWNYNIPKSIIPLTKEAHYLIHRYIRVNADDKFCYTIDGDCLDTKEKTIQYYQCIFDKFGINEPIEIIDY